MKRTPVRRAAASSRSISSIEAMRMGFEAPPRRARFGNASSAALALPQLLMSARNVRGPTFSLRISLSQSKRCASLRRIEADLLVTPSVRFCLRFPRAAA
jgi:hypothetical protein